MDRQLLCSLVNWQLAVVGIQAAATHTIWLIGFQHNFIFPHCGSMISVQSTDEHGRAPETLSKLWEQRDFTDVTLVSADDQQMEAHRGILAASSPFFKNILLKNPHQKPLLYLGNVDQARLTSILQFIYLGQVLLI